MSHTPAESDIEAAVEKVPAVDIQDVSTEKSVRAANPHPRANMPTWKWTMLLIGIYTGKPKHSTRVSPRMELANDGVDRRLLIWT